MNRDDVVASRTQPAAPGTDPIAWGDVQAAPVAYEAGATIFRQGEPCLTVMYIVTGIVRLSVVSYGGKEAVIAVLDRDEFFGESCLVPHLVRTATATAMSECSLLRISGQEITRRLHADETFADAFLARILSRNVRMEEDLIDQLFNSVEKRLARALVLLSQYGKNHGPRRVLPKVSQAVLAEMVGTTRSRVNFFMNKFRRLGFIEYDASGVKVHNSLVGFVLAD
jgi:CRP-like cAMP-binding protein